MKRLLLALALIATPAMAQDDKAEAAHTESVGQALDLIRGKKPAEAGAILDRVILEYQRLYANDKRAIYCSHNTTEAIFYMGLAATAAKQSAPRDGVALGSNWCMALWAKGFALIDQGRVAESVPFLKRAVELSPAHAHYISELAYAYQTLKRFDESLALYRQAEGYAEMADAGDRNAQKGRALRGIGYDLVELDRWDEAEAAYRKALAIDPNDRVARGELEYVNAHRKR